MPDINITVAHKVAVSDTQSIVCDNSDYTVHWTLDEEWSAYDTKTMRTIYMDGTFEDKVFSGDTIELPVCTVPGAVQIGLFAGNLRTSRVAILRALPSVRSAAGAPEDPTPDVYDQLMELIKGLGSVDPDDIAKAVADYLAAHPIEETDPTVPEWAKAETKPTYSAEEVGAIAQSDLQAATDAALAQAKASGEFDGPAGPTGPQGPAGVPGAGMDITGATVGQIAKIAAVDASGVPTAWSPVDMPSGGGGDLQWIEVVDITTEEQTQMLTISTDKDGRPISQYNALWMIFSILFPADASQTSDGGVLWIYPFPKTGDNCYRFFVNVPSWKTNERTITHSWAGTPRSVWSSASAGQSTFSDGNNDQDFLSGLCVYIHSVSDHIPAGTRVRIAVLSKGATR